MGKPASSLTGRPRPMGNLLGERVRLGQWPVPGEGAGNFSWHSLVIALLLVGTGAAPAFADVLASNVGKSTSTFRQVTGLLRRAQSFQTGS